MRQFVCARCHRDFEAESTEEEALAEAEETFGEIAVEDRVYVCDACYEQFMHWYRLTGPSRS